VTLITALGCGIGDQKDMAKLRYHKIVIMTDADVDGSHIRTLLLTFFYRQYRELVDGSLGKHHIFIAQPPLYKVKKGNKEEYLKNEQALEDFLLRSTSEELFLELAVADGEPKPAPITGADLRELARQVGRYTRALRAIDKKGDARVIDALVKVGGLDAAMLRDAEALHGVKSRVEAHLRIFHSDITDLGAQVIADEEHGGFCLHCPPRFGGVRKETIINFALVDSPEFTELSRLGSRLAKYGQGPFTLVEGSHRNEFKELAQLAELLDRIGRKGLLIQRYKGLGEMTAEQLWETTMDPARRTLLEVHADDVQQAESIFSMLMGEAVEPRREFIEQHALNVRNLDV
jgi:DNA gyrase subunit B